MRISRKIKKRLLLAVAAATVVSLIHMIWVRVSASGYNLVTMNSGTGRHVAAMYNASVVIFIIFAAILGGRLCVNFVRNRKYSDNSKNN